MSIKVLALDLERTLIDNALSARPRPGLLAFLAFCHDQFGRVAIFTTVEEADAREVLGDLERRGHDRIAVGERSGDAVLRPVPCRLAEQIAPEERACRDTTSLEERDEIVLLPHAVLAGTISSDARRNLSDECLAAPSCRVSFGQKALVPVSGVRHGLMRGFRNCGSGPFLKDLTHRVWLRGPKRWRVNVDALDLFHVGVMADDAVE